MPFWDDPDFTGSGPIRVEGGIKARSKRGDIGSSWWSRRFIDALERLEIGTRLAKGRSYARAGQVLDLEVAAGSVAATVQGSRPRPYRVSVELSPIWPTLWEKVERILAGQVIYSAKLLAGDMPEDLEQVFTELGLSLFPRTLEELTMECTCPDWSVPCKHVAAALYLLAEAFDQDPFLILAWRGRDRRTLLNNVRALRAPDSSTVDAAPVKRRSPWDELRSVPQLELGDCVDGYFSCQGRINRLDGAPSGIIVPDAILRERDPLPAEAGGVAATELVRAAYFAMGARDE
jgi:uncharacterized Zn finger protein